MKKPTWEEITKIPKWLPKWYILYAPAFLVPMCWVVGIMRERNKKFIEEIDLSVKDIKIIKNQEHKI